jgi:hypothetical protein
MGVQFSCAFREKNNSLLYAAELNDYSVPFYLKAEDLDLFFREMVVLIT